MVQRERTLPREVDILGMLRGPRSTHRTEVRSMDQLIPSLGALVAFGGIFLDAVLSTKRHKTLRFGVNWVVLGIAVPLPFRPDRYYCLSVLWRAYRKKG